MRTSLKTAGWAVACLGLLLLAGCDKHRQEEEMAAMQAPPPTPYEIKDQNGVKFAVLRQGSLITENLDNWHTLNPEFFEKLSGIKIETPAEDKTFYPGKGFVIPKVEINPEHPDQKIGRISGGYLVPKEIHGWVAIDQKTLGELVKKYMTK